MEHHSHCCANTYKEFAHTKSENIAWFRFREVSFSPTFAAVLSKWQVCSLCWKHGERLRRRAGRRSIGIHLKVLIVEPGQYPREADIEPTLEAKQKIVGGLIDVAYPFPDDNVCVVLNA